MLRILSRATAYGAAAGAVSGAAVATVLFAILGTVFGAIVGAAVGAAFGCANGVVLAAVHALGGGRWWARAGAGTTSAAAALVATVLFGHGRYPHTWASTSFLVGCAALGALLGPVSMLGAEPRYVGPGQRSRRDVATRMLVAFLALGVGAGAVVGLIIGLGVYAPTAPVAMVEGAMFGAVLALLCATVVALLRFGPHLRARR